jgi:uncharacterized protein
MPLDHDRLTARIRDVLRGQPRPGATTEQVRPLPAAEAASAGDAGDPPIREITFVPDAAEAAGDDTLRGCVVIERAYAEDQSHGRAAIGEYRERLAQHIGALRVLAAEPTGVVAGEEQPPAAFEFVARPRQDDRQRPGVPTREPLLFFDLETTGLSGGVGTLAFLVGCGWFEDGGFRTHQFFLSGYDAEHEMLARLSELVSRFSGVVTFNGRTFDVPLIEMRYAFHRLESPFDGLPHFDMLHPARRLWRRRGTAAGEWDQGGLPGEATSCALKALEEAILGMGRVGDVPGFEIPSLYFGYLRSGHLEPLQAVFEHNRLDLLSLAALTAIASRMAGEGPAWVPTPHESLAMGGLYEKAGRDDEAEACYARAGGLAEAPWVPEAIDRDIRADALKHLALLRRRQRRFVEAAEAWEMIVRFSRNRALLREAREALAIHFEHRAQDIDAARRVAERALAAERDPDRAAALQHRPARLARKAGPARIRPAVPRRPRPNRQA